MICKQCGEFMEWVDEGEDNSGQRYDLFICIECGHNAAVRQNVSREISQPRYDWDPPDGSPRRNWRGSQ